MTTRPKSPRGPKSPLLELADGELADGELADGELAEGELARVSWPRGELAAG